MSLWSLAVVAPRLVVPAQRGVIAVQDFRKDLHGLDDRGARPVEVLVPIG